MVIDENNFNQEIDSNYFDNKMSKRPLGITILSILYILVGLLTLYILFAYPEYLLPLQFLSKDLYVAVNLIIALLAAIQIMVGFGLLQGKGWAWTGAFIIIIINGALSNILGFIVAVLLIYYITRPSVKKYYGKK